MPQFIDTAGGRRQAPDEDLGASRKRLISEIAGLDGQRRSIREQIAGHRAAVSAKTKVLDTEWLGRAEHRSGQLLKEREALRRKLGDLNTRMAEGRRPQAAKRGSGLGDQFMAEARKRLAPAVFAGIYDAVCPETRLGEGNHG